MYKISDRTKALDNFHVELSNSFKNDTKIFTCPICKFEINCEDYSQDDCYTVNCPNCNYSYCIHCDFIYDPEPNFEVLLGFKNCEFEYIFINYTFYHGDDKKLTTVLFTVQSHKIKDFVKEIIKYFHENYGKDVITLEEIISVVNKYCEEYKEVNGGSYLQTHKLDIEISDGMYIYETNQLFSVDPFF